MSVHVVAILYYMSKSVVTYSISNPMLPRSFFRINHFIIFNLCDKHISVVVGWGLIHLPHGSVRFTCIKST
jgi:hypothetical protein